MWSMGKVLKTPEVMRVFIGSFWDQPLQYTDNAALFEAEEKDLLTELRNLPQNAAVRKINEFVKRARLAKVHAYLIGHLRDKMPSMVGKERKQKELIANMADVFREVQRKFNLPPGDFPNIDEFTRKCSDRKFQKFHSLNVRGIQEIDELLAKDIPKLMALLPKRVNSAVAANAGDDVPAAWSTGSSNPFADEEFGWEIASVRDQYDALFKTLRHDTNGKATGATCMAPLQGTGCPKDVLKTVWDLADVDKDGCLDADEFAVAMYLCGKAKQGESLPTELPPSLLPPSKAALRMASPTASATVK
ncbi:hypothetical protein PINS_up015986 [Pythium insidiosum]|nr:hypothetical protein PINS_up015986 [Pythium insidiosum]